MGVRAEHRAAEEVEFERFVLADSPGLLRGAYLLTGDHGVAEDLVQVALIRTLRRWRQIEGAPAAYAFVVLSNLARDRARNQRRRPRLVFDRQPPEPPAVDTIEKLLEREAIVVAARSLARPQREVVACRFLLDLTVEQTAAALGMPPGTVKSHTSRALERMRELLSDQDRENASEVLYGDR